MRKEEKKKVQFSKIIIVVVLLFAIGTGVWTMVLYSLGYSEQTKFACTVIDVLLGAIVAYSLRAHFGKKEEAEIEIEKLRMREREDESYGSDDSI